MIAGRNVLRHTVGLVLSAVAVSFALGAEKAKSKEPPVVRAAARSAADVAAVLKLAEPAPADPRPLRILLVAGPKDHGAGQHDYPAWQKAWAPYLAQSPRVTVDTAFPWPQPEQLAAADLLVLYRRNKWDAAQLAELEAFQKRGGGFVTIHWAIGADELPERFAARTGLAYPSAKYRHGIVDLRLVTTHPITRGFPATVRFTDESYWPLVGDAARVRLLGTSDEQAGLGDAILPIPIFWTHEPAGGGRTFVCVFGHYMWTFDDPLFRLLLLRGMAWAAGETASRFDALAVSPNRHFD
ncbi:MAG: ThuA domain-containing protein [Verrucomicrobia bacterium]|nr:ThuA domain-containing protein [Verrucomicrobiota bacterium]